MILNIQVGKNSKEQELEKGANTFLYAAENWLFSMYSVFI